MRLNRSFGGTAAATARARMTLAGGQHARLRAAPFSTRISRTSASVRISAPRSVAALAMACVMAPMPPRRMAPDTGFAVHLAEAVVQQHVGRAGRRGRREGADDAVESEGGLDRLVLEPLGQEVRRAFGEQVDDEALILERQLQKRARNPAALDQLREAAAGIGRRLEHEAAQHGGGPLQRRVVGRQALGIVARELGDGLLARGEARKASAGRGVSSTGQKLATGRSRISSPCRARSRSRITLGLSRLTV